MNNKPLRRSSTRDFNLMVLGQVISILGSALLRFGLSLYVLDTTGRADLYATLFALSNIPLLLSPVGGAIADRFNRRSLMVLFDFTSSVLILGFFILLSQGRASIPVIGILMVLLCTISAMYQPAVQASIPLLAAPEKIEQANGIVGGVGALSGVAAPILGGILYSAVGLPLLILGSSIAFFVSAVMEIFIRIPFIKSAHTGGLLSTLALDLRSGFRFVAHQPYILKSIVLAALLNLLLTPFFVVGGPIILRVTMQSTDTLYGAGMAVIQFSSILGALTVGAFSKRMTMRTLYRPVLLIALLMAPMVLALSPALLSRGFYPSYMLFLLCAVPVAMTMTILSVFVVARVQRHTPNDLLGKVMAIIMAVSQCASPLGQILFGSLFQAFSLKVYLPVAAVSLSMLILTVLTKVLYRGQAESGAAEGGTAR